MSHLLTQNRVTIEERYRAILRNHLPAEAVDWVYGFLDTYRVHFHITKERRTKWGDYRWPQRNHDYHEMSVNGDLGKSLFLWVFLHEAAHLMTHLKYALVKPHGHEWQGELARLRGEHVAWFPADIRPQIACYASRIPLNRKLGREIVENLLKRD